MTTGEHFRDTLEAHNLLHRHQALVRVLSEVPRGRVHSLTFLIDDGYCTRSFSMSTKTFDKQDYLFIRTKIPTCFTRHTCIFLHIFAISTEDGLCDVERVVRDRLEPMGRRSAAVIFGNDLDGEG